MTAWLERKTELVRTRWGFYQLHPLPTEEELSEYYQEKYFQEGRGSYEIHYSDEEKQWFRLKAWLLRRKTELILPYGSKCLLDVGCGEGWLMAEFQGAGHEVYGLDYSRAGLESQHPDLCACLVQGDIYESLDDLIRQGKEFDAIALCNVIEHVRYPAELLEYIKAIMHLGTLLLITAPNDFSSLHRHLLDNGLVDKEWWLSYPDHLSYFNKESMENLLDDLGFEVKAVVADNPIDLNLLNDNSNYIRDRSKGKNTHYFRIRVDNFLGGIDRDGLLQLYEVLGRMGVGRDLTYFCCVKS